MITWTVLLLIILVLLAGLIRETQLEKDMYNEVIDEINDVLEKKWVAIVKASQGGIIYTHVFDSKEISKILENIKEGLDLENAESVSIEIHRHYSI